MVTGDVWTTVWLTDQAKLGNWPIAGGVLDQASPFLDAYHMVQSLTARLLKNPQNAR